MLHHALRFFKITGKTCGIVSIYTKSTLKNLSTKDLSMMLMQCFCAFFFQFVFIKASVVGSHLDKQLDAIQMDTHNICLYKEVDIKYVGCNLKTRELLDCALIQVCVVSRLNVLFISFSI